MRTLVLFLALAAFTVDAATFEGLVLNWPEQEGWKVANRQENKNIQMLELVREGETLENWTQIGTMIWNKGAVLPHIDKAYALYSSKLRAGCPGAQINTVLLEADIPFPRVIFTLDCPKTPKDGHPESAVWLIVQGKQSLYVAHRAARTERLSENLQKKWASWLKSAKVMER